MALKLEKTYKGVVADYWKIIEIKSIIRRDETEVTLALYKDKQTRDEDILNHLKVERILINGLDYTRETAYDKIVESKLDEEGNETNDFVSATDC